MKKIFGCFVLLLICLSLHAIDIDGKGINLGLNYTKLWGNVREGSDLTPGFTIGAFVNKRVNNWLVIQPGLHLTSKILYKDGKERLILDNDVDGLFNEDEYDLIDNDGDGLIDEDRQELEFEAHGHYRLFYLEIPILFKVMPLLHLPHNTNFFFGPSFDFLLWGDYTAKAYGSYFTYDGTSGCSFFNCEIICGLEYNVGKYSLQLRLNQGILENNYKSYGEYFMEYTYEHGGSVWPGIDNYSEYCKFQKVSGYGTSVTVLLSINL